MKLITIQTFSNNMQLMLAKNYLESEGIECFIQDEHASQIYGGAVDSLRSKLQVKPEDCEKAIHLLIEVGYAKPEDYQYQVSPLLLWLRKAYKKITKFFTRN